MSIDEPLKAWRHYVNSASVTNVSQNQHNLQSDQDNLAYQLNLTDEMRSALSEAALGINAFLQSLNLLHLQGDSDLHENANRLIDRAEELISVADPREIGFR